MLEASYSIDLEDLASNLVTLAPSSTRKGVAKLLAQIFQIFQEEVASDNGANSDS